VRGNEPQPGAVPEGSGSIPGTSDEIDEVMDGGADESDVTEEGTA
jgi:hypothetical protein